MKDMNEITNWDFNGQKVRTVEIEGEPYFVGKDVSSVLGYSNPRDALAKHVDDEDKGVVKCDTLGGTQNTTVINESGVYALVFGSKLPAAKAFKRWVTSEVLPTLRKTGSYRMQDSYQIEDPVKRAQRWIEEQQERKALEERVAEQDQKIQDLQPKAMYADTVLTAKDVKTPTQIAKDYGRSAQWLNRTLHELGIQYRQNGTWVLYQKYADKGYVKSRTHSYADNAGEFHTSILTCWTEKGRKFIYELLAERGIYPAETVNAN